MKDGYKKFLSKPEYGIKVERNVYVPMRDGVELAVNIYRPDKEGKYPALLALSPYGKELQEMMVPSQSLGVSAVWDGNIEAGDIDYFVTRGYVYVIGDLRGTGLSKGEFEGVFSKQEGIDGHDLVEWIANEPWCDGNVGMAGRSYFAQTQIETAIQQPPHLKAICPIAEFSDFYRNMAYHGGVLKLFLYGLWDGRIGTSGFARNNPVSTMVKELSKEQLKLKVQEALDDPDIKNYPNLFHLLHYPVKNPAFFDIVLNPHDGPYYWERSSYPYFDKIKIPTLIGGAWCNFMAKSCFKTFNGINTTKKLIVTGKTMADRPWREDKELILRWYEHWLKGIDTGILSEPAIKYYVYGADEWRYAEQWPLPGTEWNKFFLQSWEKLGPEPEQYTDEPDCFLQQPLHLTNKRDTLEYYSLPLDDDLTVIGPAALYIHASIDQPDTNWIIKLALVEQDGSEQHLGTSYLKASHRALDSEKSKPYQPWHPHSKSETVISGEVYEYAIELDPLSCVFKRGSRIKLEIGSMESANDREMQIHYHFHLCSSRTTLHKIYRSNKYPSHLLLPVIPKP